MQRGDSIHRKRSRRRALGLTTAAAVHLLAALSLLPVARLSRPDRSHPSDADAPVIVVQLVRLRPPEAPASPAPQPDAAPKAKSISLPEPDARFEASPSEPEAPAPAAPTRPQDNEALYRVPFRDAVAQADARLRAGLGCAHVDLEALPKSVFDLCSAMVRFDDPDHPHRPARGPLG